MPHQIRNIIGLEEALMQVVSGSPTNLDGGNASSTFDTIFDGGGA
jgi:hypothetical protein